VALERSGVSDTCQSSTCTGLTSLSDLINNDTVPWWKGFYTYGTTFNLTAALADTSSTNYALLISDMDVIARQLLRLQAANVPVLWRPLHEAEGGWFWVRTYLFSHYLMKRSTLTPTCGVF
jgi:hypothetical protein